METGNQIKRNLSRPEALSYIRAILEGESGYTRTALALKICEEYGFKDPGGKNQVIGCLKALRELEAKGFIKLPEPRIKTTGPTPRRLLEPVSEPRVRPFLPNICYSLL